MKWTAQTGFTLVEAIISVQFLAILAVLAAPIFPVSMQGFALRGAAREVYADLEKARMAAIMENHRYRFVVIDAHTYQIHSDLNNNGIEDPGETVVTRNVQIDCPHIQLSATNVVTFAANGTAPTYGTITASNEGGTLRSLEVVVGSGGRVIIQRPNQ